MLSRSTIRYSKSLGCRGTLADDELTFCVTVVDGCGMLYAPHGHPWRCRHCYDLTYATRQAALRYRLILKGQKVRERLGGELGVLSPFPARPKGMHWRRYRRLRKRHDEAVEKSLALLRY